MGIFSRKPAQVVAKASAKKLEALAESSKDQNMRYLAAKRLDREDIWQHMVHHDPENSSLAMLNCKDLQFLAKLRDQNPKDKYFIQKHMNEVAFSVVQKKIEVCSDQEQLFALVMNGKTDIPEYTYLYVDSVNRIRTQALSKITKQEDLFRIAVNKGGKTAQDAISRISDPELLVRIVLAPEKSTGRNYREILSRIHDTDRLQYIADHSADSYIVQLAKTRLREEKSTLLCHNSHDWVYLRTETHDDGDSPRMDYKYEKCTRCGVIRHSTYISGQFFRSELRYDAVSE